MNALRISDIAILKAPAPPLLELAHQDLRLLELTSEQTREIMAGEASMGRKIPLERIERRFRHGLRFFQLWMGDSLIGSTWAVPGLPRYIDELGWNIPLLPNETWIRDVYIAPTVRGRKLFSHIISLMTDAVNPACATIWSDVDWSNRASMKAHLATGFKIWKRLRAIDIADRLLLRTQLDNWHLPLRELEAGRKVLWWTEALRERHKGLIA